MSNLPTTPSQFTYIGKHRRAVEHRRFVVGKGNYAGDVLKPGTLHVAIVASPYASAKILAIDTSAALALHGVVSVVTGAEINAAVFLRYVVFLWPMKLLAILENGYVW